MYLADPSAPGGRRFNPAAFDATTPKAQDRQGTLARNALRGFPLNQLDFGMHRQFNFTERVSLHFRAEFFNLLNHPNFGDPDGNLASSTFGLSTSMLGKSLSGVGGFNSLYQVGGPRSIQLAFKVQF